ncbi:hypothetical protein NC77_02320 [Janthinobacterium lividum]|nr:hypothetical protein NC77_02320 [Janthinobacterium lividum]
MKNESLKSVKNNFQITNLRRLFSAPPHLHAMEMGTMIPHLRILEKKKQQSLPLQIAVHQQIAPIQIITIQ